MQESKNDHEETKNPNTDNQFTTGGEEEESLTLKENFRILFGASRGFWLVNMVNFGDGIAYFGILHLMTLFISRDVGFSDHTTGIAVSTFTGLVTLFMFGGGFISDWLGVRKSLTLCLLGLLLGRLMFTASPVAPGVLAGFSIWSGLIIMALATGILQPTLYAGVKEYTDPRTATIGYSLLYAIMNLGIVAEAFVSPFIRQTYGITGVYLALIGITGLMLLLHLTFFTKKREKQDRVVFVEKKVTAEPEKSKRMKLSELPFLDSRFIFFIFVLLPVRTLFAHQFLTMPDYITRCFPEHVGARLEWFQGLNPLIIVIFVPLIAAFTRKVSVIKMMIIGTTVSALTTFILIPGPSLTMLIVYIIIFSFGEAIWSSRFLEYVANLAPVGRVGAYMGLAGIPWFFAKFTTGFYSGIMIEKFIPFEGVHDSGTMWLVYSFIACISPIGLIIGKKWIDKGVPD
ncbi:MAG: MFS transporter [Candidatus Electryonea clarkiae]|nr:MFS transporter [Candidatus Electryonea clarkiae]MDP8288127.1 MFS transporter [Candidatus Electryonea clarkiae]